MSWDIPTTLDLPLALEVSICQRPKHNPNHDQMWSPNQWYVMETSAFARGSSFSDLMVCSMWVPNDRTRRHVQTWQSRADNTSIAKQSNCYVNRAYSLFVLVSVERGACYFCSEWSHINNTIQNKFTVLRKSSHDLASFLKRQDNSAILTIIFQCALMHVDGLQKSLRTHAFEVGLEPN